MKFGATVEFSTRVWVEFETEDEAPGEVALRTAAEQAALGDRFTPRTVEVRRVDA